MSAKRVHIEREKDSCRTWPLANAIGRKDIYSVYMFLYRQRTKVMVNSRITLHVMFFFLFFLFCNVNPSFQRIDKKKKRNAKKKRTLNENALLTCHYSALFARQLIPKDFRLRETDVTDVVWGSQNGVKITIVSRYRIILWIIPYTYIYYSKFYENKSMFNHTRYSFT